MIGISMTDFHTISGVPIWIGDAMIKDGKYSFTDPEGISHILEAPASSGHGYELCKINNQWVLVTHYPRD